MNVPPTRPRGSAVQLLLMVFAVLACVGAILRIVNADLSARIDETTLMYLGVAGALLLLRDVKSLAFGDYRVEFERKIDELETKVENAQALAIGSGSSKRITESPALADAGDAGRFAPSRGPVDDDPWKGVFGGRRTNGTRELDADVTPIGVPGLFRVRLRVRSTSPDRDPLRGVVQFFLHPTFTNDRPIVSVSPGGVAELTLTSYGAFTVGALADDGRTKLELDLAELESAPAEFRAN